MSHQRNVCSDFRADKNLPIRMENHLPEFEHFIRVADTYWPCAARTQVTIRRLPERNVVIIFSNNASLVAPAEQIGVSASQ